jgi:tRNA U34 5-methylaminomethyl-2-thiouridine-forming methyltransferase MnmC
MYRALRPEGILVTYCAQGEFKRTLKKAGFQVEKLQGPPGKREMTRALK